MVFKTKRVEILCILDAYSYSFGSTLLKICRVLLKLICNKRWKQFLICLIKQEIERFKNSMKNINVLF